MKISFVEVIDLYEPKYYLHFKAMHAIQAIDSWMYNLSSIKC